MSYDLTNEATKAGQVFVLLDKARQSKPPFWISGWALAIGIKSTCVSTVISHVRESLAPGWTLVHRQDPDDHDKHYYALLAPGDAEPPWKGDHSFRRCQRCNDEIGWLTDEEFGERGGLCPICRRQVAAGQPAELPPLVPSEEGP